jgi:hypothetical protein
MVALDISASPPVTPDPTVLYLPVDAEHAGIRTAGCATFFVGSAVIFVFVSFLMPQAVGIAALAGLLGGAFCAYGLDRQLRGRWTSGRALAADPAQIAVIRKNEPEFSIDPRKQVNVIAYRFEVPRNGRVKKGWFVLALVLEQDEALVPVYTFASPDQFEKLKLAKQFDVLQRPDRLKSNANSAQEMKLAGKMRRMHDAEKVRGLEGAEVTFEQFEQYIQFLQDSYPAWMLK